MFDSWKDKRALKRAVKRADKKSALSGGSQFHVIRQGVDYMVVNNAFIKQYNRKANKKGCKKIDVRDKNKFVYTTGSCSPIKNKEKIKKYVKSKSL